MILKRLVIIILILNSFSLVGQEKKVVVIDPGHGGTDSGAIGVNGKSEKDIALKISRLITEINDKDHDSSVEIFQTRYQDTLISLGDRIKLAQNLQADLFISIHCNHSDNPRAKGIEVYVPLKGKYVEDSILLAHNIQSYLKRRLGYKTRGVKFGNFQVLRDLANTSPVVLVELGFLSNEDEGRYISELKNVQCISSIILKSIEQL